VKNGKWGIIKFVLQSQRWVDKREPWIDGGWSAQGLKWRWGWFEVNRPKSFVAGWTGV
jgi:hypothetical protein